MGLRLSGRGGNQHASGGNGLPAVRNVPADGTEPLHQAAGIKQLGGTSSAGNAVAFQHAAAVSVCQNQAAGWRRFGGECRGHLLPSDVGPLSQAATVAPATFPPGMVSPGFGLDNLPGERVRSDPPIPQVWPGCV